MNDTTLNPDDSGGEGSRRRRPNNCQSRKLIFSALFVCAIGVSVVAALVASRNGSRRGDEPMIFWKGKKSPAASFSGATQPSTGEETLGRRLEESRSTMQEPDLTIAEDQDGTPLGECQGGCEEDGNCEGSLVCYRRWHTETVPGCSGEGLTRVNYCCNRPEKYLFYVSTDDLLGLCEGDCDTNDDCMDGLICGERSKYDPVPGCDGMGRKNSEYCRYPDDVLEDEAVVEKDDDGDEEKEEPVLQIIQVSDGTLLGECEGDCDRDSDCKDSLVCYKRSREETVPGCPGPGISGKDYCSDRPDNYLLFVGGNPKRKFPLGLCKGDCDSDDECADDLVCQQRDGYEPVPGCDGMGRRNADYCRIPDMIPANALNIIKGSDGALLGECEGDCDSDKDCEDSLVCYKRAGDEIVPGCSGMGVYKKDYCIDRPDNYLLFRGKNRGDPLGLCEGDCDSNDDCVDDLVCQQRDGFDSVPGCNGTGRKNADYCRIPDWSTFNPIVEVPCGEGEVCKANYCGGCHAMCEPVTKSPAATNECNRENQCLDPRGGCANLVQCLIDPCDVEGAEVVTTEMVTDEVMADEIVIVTAATTFIKEEMHAQDEGTATAPPSPPTKRPTSFPTTTECYYVFITLFFGSNPEETSWEVTRHAGDDASATIVSSEPYAIGQTKYWKELCLSIGDYKFTIYDSGEDGMGEGNYTVSTNNREIIAEGGSFGSSDITPFPLPTLQQLESRKV